MSEKKETIPWWLNAGGAVGGLFLMGLTVSAGYMLYKSFSKKTHSCGKMLRLTIDATESKESPSFQTYGNEIVALLKAQDEDDDGDHRITVPYQFPTEADFQASIDRVQRIWRPGRLKHGDEFRAPPRQCVRFRWKGETREVIWLE